MASREVSNGTRTTERWTNEGTAGYYSGSPLARQRALTAAEAADLAAVDSVLISTANAQTLRDKAVQALTTNATYLARSAPTVAQNTAQTQALTRQVNALIRLLVTADTSDISGT